MKKKLQAFWAKLKSLTKTILQAFWKGFKIPFKFLLEHILTFQHWYSFIFWYGLDITFIVASFLGIAHQPDKAIDHALGLMIWSLNTGLHLWFSYDLWKKNFFKKRGIKEYRIFNPKAQSVVDAIDQRDLNFDSDKYGWFFGFWDKKTYTYQIKSKNLKTGEEEVFMDYEAPEENKEVSTEQQTSNQGDN